MSETVPAGDIDWDLVDQVEREECKKSFFAFYPAEWHNTWPSNFLAFIKTESELITLQYFLSNHPVGPDPTGSVGKHFFWGSKIWKIGQENRTEINNHLNKLFVPSVHLKSGNDYYLQSTLVDCLIYRTI